jgi:hypothetical protein
MALTLPPHTSSITRPTGRCPGNFGLRIPAPVVAGSSPHVGRKPAPCGAGRCCCARHGDDEGRERGAFLVQQGGGTLTAAQCPPDASTPMSPPQATAALHEMSTGSAVAEAMTA